MFHISKSLMDEALGDTPVKGKRSMEPLKSLAIKHGLPLQVLEDKEVTNDAEVHMNSGDLWHCLQGEVHFICGGELVAPWTKKNVDGSEDKTELKAKEIKNGTKILLKAGDWLWIPPGEPHKHICEDLARLAIIKVPKA
jgi:mannose-6-phosphate isomerase-like protein (cupin superfamily)